MDANNSFFEACEEGDLEKAKLLIEKGTNIEAKDNDGNNPLIYASCYGRIEIVKYLIEKGADIEAKGNYGYTPLIVASCYGYIEVVKYLVEIGTDTNHKNNNEKTFYYYLNENQKKEIDLIIEDIEERKRMIKPCSFLATRT